MQCNIKVECKNDGYIKIQVNEENKARIILKSQENKTILLCTVDDILKLRDMIDNFESTSELFS